jgi:hypothetical protein
MQTIRKTKLIFVSAYLTSVHADHINGCCSVLLIQGVAFVTFCAVDASGLDPMNVVPSCWPTSMASKVGLFMVQVVSAGLCCDEDSAGRPEGSSLTGM